MPDLRDDPVLCEAFRHGRTLEKAVTVLQSIEWEAREALAGRIDEKEALRNIRDTAYQNIGYFVKPEGK